MSIMKIVVYSVNIGGYDEFKEPTIVDPNIRYILFTDNKNYKSKIWEVNHTDFLPKNLDNRKKARYIKTNPHIVLPEHDISLWVDHCFKPKFNNAINLIELLLFTENKNIMIFKHSFRSCLYDEAKKIIKEKLDLPEIVNNQILKYRKEGFPSNIGLFETGFIVRRNNDKVNKFNELWWEEIKRGSGRDQLSNMYAAWKTSLKIDRILYGKSCYENPFLTSKIPHPKRWVV
jgi:hypothetical protein